MEFHGRIYRASVFHFHEPDLAKSLLLFAKAPEEELSKREDISIIIQLACAAAFKYNKFA